MVAAQAVLPGLRYAALAVDSPERFHSFIGSMRMGLGCSRVHMYAPCFVVDQHRRFCCLRASRTASPIQLPDVEFEDRVDPGVEVSLSKDSMIVSFVAVSLMDVWLVALHLFMVLQTLYEEGELTRRGEEPQGALCGTASSLQPCSTLDPLCDSVHCNVCAGQPCLALPN
jgi:hypothetical protein